MHSNVSTDDAHVRELDTGPGFRADPLDTVREIVAQYGGAVVIRALRRAIRERVRDFALDVTDAEDRATADAAEAVSGLLRKAFLQSKNFDL